METLHEYKRISANVKKATQNGILKNFKYSKEKNVIDHKKMTNNILILQVFFISKKIQNILKKLVNFVFFEKILK